MPCPMCKVRSPAEPLKVHQKFDGQERGWLWCDPCKLYYIRDYPPVAYEDWALEGYPFGRQHAQVTGFQYHLGLVHRHVLPPGKLLDVGAGPGYAVMNADCNGWQARGIEPWGSLARWGDKHLQVEMLEDYPDDQQSYDVILSTDVIEHIPDCQAFLDKLYAMQAPGGLLFLTTPNGTSWPARNDPEKWSAMQNRLHCILFGPEALDAALERTGWNVIEGFTACGPREDEMIHVIARKPGRPRVREVPRQWLQTLQAADAPRRAVKLHEYVSIEQSAAGAWNASPRLDKLEARLAGIERQVSAGVIEGQNIVLRDDEGRIRAVFGVEDDGGVVLQMMDGDQRPRCRLGALGDGSPLMALLDGDGRSRIGMILGDDGTPHFGLYDEAQNVRALLTLENDEPKFVTVDPEGATTAATDDEPALRSAARG